MPKRLQCKQKYDEDEKAAAHVFQDFMKTFHSNAHPNKVFIKSETLNAKNDSEANQECGRIYKPSPLIPQSSSSAAKKALECAKLVRDVIYAKSSKGIEKPKSNLDSLKEELKQKHSERILRKNTVSISETAKPSTILLPSISIEDNTIMKERDEIDLPGRTTNLFINNLRPNITENDLMVLFGEYGPLASVKIMWPRGNIIITGNSIDDDDRRGNANCGFVAFMSRKDSERALECLTAHSDMRISWGRPVDLPSFPVYIPPSYQKLLKPQLFTGYPFNAQPIKSIKTFAQNDDTQDILKNSRVIVTLPWDKKQLNAIHRMVEFVVREGPLFEAMIMNRELKNPLFEFLFANKSTAHAFYRWKLYSVAHGESTTNWSKREFRMFKGGAVWVPPTIPNFFQGMPDHICEATGFAVTSALSAAQETRLIQFIQGMRMAQQSIRDVTVYCLNHSNASRTIVDIVCTSLLNPSTNPTYKIARLYLLNDILHNVWRAKDSHHFLTALERYLDDIFDGFQTVYWGLRYNYDRVQFKTRVQRVLRAWTNWALFTRDRIKMWEQKFQDKMDVDEDTLEIDERPMDGQRLRELSKSNNIDWNYIGVDIDDIEHPIDEPRVDLEPQHRDFVMSKWEAVDPTEIEANAMSTKRLHALENNRLEEERSNSHDKAIDLRTRGNSSLKSWKYSSESLRSKLREVEVQILQFQDDLESGKVKPKRGRKADEEVLHYRRKLTKRLALESKEDIPYS